MNKTICISEGFATAASVYQATGYPTVASFGAGNLKPVAIKIRKQFPDASLILCADDDQATQGNPGLSQATLAAQAVGGFLAVPDFGPNRPDSVSDFNDVSIFKGDIAVKNSILSAAEPSSVAKIAGQPTVMSKVSVANEDWPDPQPLIAIQKPEPYPIDALPIIVRDAVQEVINFAKAPMALVSSSAIAALSLSIQPHVNVKRAQNLTGPVSQFLLVVADSGERKSTCDGYFTRVIREYEKIKKIEALPLINNFNAAMEIWEAKRSGLKEKIRKLTAAGEPADEFERGFHKLGLEKPRGPVVPRLIYGDVTPESLAYNLATVWPFAGIVSSEGGTVFGSHGMSGDSVMKNLSMLNVFWDGGDVAVDRKTTDSFSVSGARLTMSLQVQESTLKSFIARSGSLARGTGFLARFLFSFPESTQGTRNFCEAPADWPAIEKFNQRISEILDLPIPVDENGMKAPALMVFTPEAKLAWETFHNAIEGQLGDGGELRNVRDVSSKSADNAARLAALFHVFDHGVTGNINLECFESASRIVAWHLDESRRFFGESSLPPELKNAVKLDEWLIKTCRDKQIFSFHSGKILQNCPSGLRSKPELDAALEELLDLGRVRLKTDGKRRVVEVNPKLLEMGRAS